MDRLSTSFTANGRHYGRPARPTLAICADGTDPAYLDDALARGLMPRLREALEGGGTLALGQAQVPTFTNPNNCCIVTGVSAAVHGIAGNHYLSQSGEEVQLTDPSALRAPTIHAQAERAGVRALCVTAKDKLRRLLASGDVAAVSAENAHEQPVPGLGERTAAEHLGRANPGIYDPELSAYTLDLALHLGRALGAELVYASLTDYVQHTAAPRTALADAFYRGIDERLGRALDAGWIVGLAADHGMNAKSRADGRPEVRYLDDALEAAGVRGFHVVLPITDPYVTHHGALGSLAWVHVPAPDLDRARGALGALAGVEGVLDRAAAARVFELPEDRIGDLVVLADRATVLGSSESKHDLSALEGPLRSHGGLHEQTVPIAVLNPLRSGAIDGRELRNRDLHDLLLNDVI